MLRERLEGEENTSRSTKSRRSGRTTSTIPPIIQWPSRLVFATSKTERTKTSAPVIGVS